MRLYCTECSANKRQETADLPAIERYVSARIDRIATLAEEDSCGFAILSGKFGLLSGTEEIPYYDQRLRHADVERMSEIVRAQLGELGASEAKYFTVGVDQDPHVAPYRAVMEAGCERAGVPLVVELI